MKVTQKKVTTFGKLSCYKGMRRLRIIAALCAMMISARACTIFLLTDSKATLFCNNEDWSNPVTRLWFVPAGADYYGCAYVGFDNGWAQGGLNSEGLAFDWVAGGNSDYMLDTKLQGVRGNSSQRMLETCATVEEAIAFYEKHREASFARARVMVADRTGASAIIGARDGKAYAERSITCRGFGYGNERLQKALTKNPKATVEEGIQILRECRQDGEFATKYSNIFDLKSGDIHIFARQEKSGVILNLRSELSKGGHYYDMPNLREQLQRPVLSLLKNMRRMPLDAYKTIPDHAPEVTARIRKILEAAAREPLHEEDFAPSLWKHLTADEPSVRGQIRAMGNLLSITRVETDPGDGPQSHRFRIDFDFATILVGYMLDSQNRIASIVTDDVEQKSR